MMIIGGEGATFGEMVVGFFEEEEMVGSDRSTDSWSTVDLVVSALPEEENVDEEEDAGTAAADRLVFWESQHQLLKTTLYRSTSLEARIREDAEAALRESRSAGPTPCSCRRPVAGKDACRLCLLRDVVERLRSAGYDAAVCRSKWRSTPDIPAGEHVYADVVDTKGKSPVRVVIEPDFRGEFEMGRANQEYSRLVSRLPHMYVGKSERLKAVIKILCGAAKECAKENKMHIGPWRRHKYMQAKWFGDYKRTGPVNFAVEAAQEERRRPKVTVSMLTSDLSEWLPPLQCSQVVAVL